MSAHLEIGLDHRQRSFPAQAIFAIGWVLSLGVFLDPIRHAIELGLSDDRYSYILLVPVISAFLVWLNREGFLSQARYSSSGIPVIVSGLLFALPGNDSLSSGVLGALITSLGLGLLCFGPRSMRTILFPSLFLLLAIPAPPAVMKQVVILLQRGSAEVTEWIFWSTGAVYTRDGFIFGFKTVNIEVAEECSGVRSATSIFVCSILAGHILLRAGWSKLAFALLAIPIVILKNAVRIAAITWLGVNVDQGFFTGNLHNYSGMPFSILALALLIPAMWGLQKLERRTAKI